MSDVEGFCDAMAHLAGATEADIAVAVAWFLAETRHENSVPLKDICDFMETEGIRNNINRTRLQSRLTARRDISAPKGRPVSISKTLKAKFKNDFGAFLTIPAPEIRNTVLQLEDFSEARPYVLAIAKQINGCRQFEFFDGCAVLMRRLAEILIIDAFEAKSARDQISVNGNYKMMNSLISALLSGGTFKLSRNAPKWLEQLKELGDNAAHSRTYTTKKIDIDDFSASYRKLIAELQSFQGK